MSQNRIMLGFAEKGSITALAASGIRIMSLSLIAFQPAIEEPSNMMPSRKTSSSMVETCWAVCCHLPRGSVNRRSTYSTECSVSISSTFPAPLAAPAGFLAMYDYPVASHNWCAPHHATASRGGPLYWFPPGAESGIRAIFCRRALDRVLAAFAGADADDILDRRDEDLAVANASGAGGVDDCLHRTLQDRVVTDDFDLHLGEEIDHVLGAAVQLGVALLAAKSLCLDHGDALQADFVQRFFHLIQFERLDDSLDLLHARSHPGCPGLPVWLPVSYLDRTAAAQVCMRRAKRQCNKGKGSCIAGDCAATVHMTPCLRPGRQMPRIWALRRHTCCRS